MTAKEGTDTPEQRVNRPNVAGKFLVASDQKLYLRGATYGTFRGRDGYGTPQAVRQDFAMMAAHGVNAVRTYTTPPAWLLDEAAEAGLWVMVGLAWEQHVTFLDDRRMARSIQRRVAAGVRSCAGHPAVLAFAVGNEIPASVVRWHGPRKVERFLERLVLTAKAEDPGALATYVNYPSTEYLELPFVDFSCVNVFLEDERRLDAYVARLQSIAGDTPLVISELGLDSRRNGVDAQAAAVAAQLRTVFSGGCAGAFLFSWTDDWHRSGADVEDWEFGLVDRDRRPKPALHAAQEVFREVPLPARDTWPSVSVVVCTYNGAGTLADCLDGLARVQYPNLEVIVVDDGSTDATAEIARRFPVRLVQTDRAGLSCARNVGLAVATGEIVAYIDDDARPDPHWLAYLVQPLLTSTDAAAGGPNIPPPAGGTVARSIARAPGAPVHVLLPDGHAEHIPGCNMAFRTDVLRDLGGFDEQFRQAGDDVDVCWRLQAAGRTIGFAPGAMVWHRPRRSVPSYARQQFGYGRSEALLERKWPERYNFGGHARWRGHVYGGAWAGVLRARRIDYGVWGTGLFQSRHPPSRGPLAVLSLLPEWYAALAAVLAIAIVEVITGDPLVAVPWVGLPLSVLPLLVLAAPLAFRSVRAARRAIRPGTPGRRRIVAVTALLHLIQPPARLVGRLLHGLTPWRRYGRASPRLPRSHTAVRWTETWQPLDAHLEQLERAVRAAGVPVHRGRAVDRWDLEVLGGGLGAARVRAVLEEHGHGRQLVRFRCWPRAVRPLVVIALLAAAAAASMVAGSSLTAYGLLAAIAVLGVRTVRDCTAATSAVRSAVEGILATERARPEIVGHDGRVPVGTHVSNGRAATDAVFPGTGLPAEEKAS